MPDLSNVKIISPLSGQAKPTYGAYKRHEPIGSKDTALSQLTGNFYDRSFIPEFSQTDQRYHNQSWVNSVGHWAAGLGIKTASGIPSMVGGITSLVASPLALSKDISFQDVFDYNPFNLIGKSVSKAADDALPLFQREDFHDLNFMKQLGRPGELFTANLDSFSFLAQSFLGGGLLAKAGVGAKIASRFAKADDVSSALTNLTGPNIAKTASLIDAIATNTVLTANEAATEAKEAAENVKRTLLDARLANKNTLTDEQIEAKAQSAAYNVFWENAITLSITNGAFVKLLSPLFKPKAALTRNNPFELELAKDGLVKGKTYTGFEKFLYDKGYTPGVLTKSILGQVGSEGLLEENLQYSIQKVNEADKVSDSFYESIKAYGQDFITSGLDLTDKDRGKAIGLGALLGGGGAGVASALGFGARSEARNYRDDKAKYISDLNSSYTDLKKSSVIKKNEEVNGRLYEQDGKFYHDVNGQVQEIPEVSFNSLTQQLPIDQQGKYNIPSKYEVDSNGELVVDQVKAKDLARNATVHKELDDLIATELSKVNPDELKLRLYQREKLAHLAKTAFKAGATDVLFQKLDELASLGQQGAAELGISDQTKVAQEVQAMKDHVTRLEELYKTVNNSTVIGSTATEALENNARRKDYMMTLGSRIIALDDLIAQTRSSYEESLQNLKDKYEAEDQDTVGKVANLIAQSSQDAQALRDLFAERNQIINSASHKNESQKLEEINSKVAGKLRDISDRQSKLEDSKELLTLAQEADIQALSAIKINDDYLTKAREEAGRVFNKLLDPAKGYDNFVKHTKDRSLLTPYDRIRLPYQLHKDIFEKEYDFYEERKVKELAYKQTLANADHENFSELVNEFVKWAQSKAELTPEVASSLNSLVSTILDRQVRLYPQEAGKLIDIVTTMVGKTLEGLEATINASLEAGFDPETDIAEDEVQAELQKLYDQYKEVEAALGNLATQTDDITARLEALAAYSVPLKTEEQLRQEAADVLLDPASNVILNGASPDFDDLDRVLLEAELVETYIANVLSAKGSDPLYTPVLERAKELLKALKELEKKVLATRADKELKIRQEMLMRLEGLMSLLDLENPNSAVVRAIGQDQAAKLVLLAEQQPQHAYYVMMDLIASTPNLDFKEQKETILQNIRDLKVWTSTSAFALKLSDGEVATFLSSPVRGLQNVLAKLTENERQLGAPNQEALSRYLSDYDIVQLTKNLLQYEGKLTTKEDVAAIVKLYMRAAALKDLELASSGKSYLELTKIYLKLVEENKAKQGANEKFIPPPTDAQLKAVSELVRFLASPNKQRNYAFDNVAAVKAPAGAGKTTVLFPFLEQALGYAKENILVAATTESAAKLIAEQTTSAYGATPFEGLIKSLKDKSFPPKVSLIVLDEAGSLTVKELQELSSLVVEHNLANPNAKLKVVMLYDSAQATAGNVATPSLDLNAYYEVPSNITEYFQGDETAKEAYRRGRHTLPDGSYDPRFAAGVPFVHHILDISPLATTFRSPIAEVVALQNAYRTGSKVTSVRTGANTDGLSMKGALGTLAAKDATQIMSLVLRSKNENPDRTRMIVVGSDAKVSRYTTELANAGITDVQVLTPHTARGLSADEVYVDIVESDSLRYAETAPFNQAMYTATSRAVKFVYVTGVTSEKHTIDHGLPTKLATILAEKKTKFDTVIEHLKTRIQAFGETPPPTQTPAQTPQTPTQAPQEGQEAEQVIEEEEVSDMPEEIEEPPINGRAPMSPDAILQAILLEISKFQAQYASYFTFDPTKVDRIERVNVTAIIELLNKLVSDYALPVKAVERKSNSWYQDIVLSDGHVINFGSVLGGVSGDNLTAEQRVDNLAGLVAQIVNHFVDTGQTDYLRPMIELYKSRNQPPTGGTTMGNTNSHKLRHPQSEAFDDQFGAINPGDKVYFAKEESNGLSRINVYTDGPNNTYRLIGVLGESEVAEVSTKVGVNLNSLSPTKFRPKLTQDPSGRNLFEASSALTQIVPARVGQSSHDIVYQYADAVTHNFESSPDDPNGLKAYARWYFNKFFDGKPEQYISNYQYVIDHPEEFFQLIAYKSEKEVAADFPNIKAAKRPKLNVPYLVVKNLQSNTGKPISNQFNRLRSTVLTRNSPAAEKVGLKHIDEFVQRLNTLESKLAGLNLPGAYAAMASGKPLKLGSDVYYPFHAFIVELSKAFRRKHAGEAVGDIQMTNNSVAGSPIAQALPTISATLFPQEVLQLAYELDVLMHDNQIDSQREKAKRQYTGAAQKAFSKIANQNLIITLPNGKTKILRDYYVTEDRNDNRIEVSTGASLLGPIKFVREGGKSFNPSIKASLLTTLTKYANRLASRGLTDSARYKLIKAIVDAPSYLHMEPLTLDDLNQLFGPEAVDDKGQFTKISEGFGLRTPLPKVFSRDFYADKNINDLTLNSFVESNLQNIFPTSITLEFGQEDTPITDFTPAIELPIQTEFSIRKFIRDNFNTVKAKAVEEAFPKEDIDNFMRSMGAKKLEDAIETYRKNIFTEVAYEQKQHSIYAAIQSLRASVAKTSAKERALTAIKQSHAVTDVGRNQGQYAARDFMRAAAYLELLPGIDRNHIYDLLDFARAFYAGSPTQVRDLQFLLDAYGGVNPAENFESWYQAYVDAFSELGFTLPPIERSSSLAADVLSAVETIVKKSSDYRNTERSSTPALSLDPAFINWFNSLREAAEASDTDTVEKLVQGKRNQKHVTKFLDLAERSSLDMDEVTNDVSKVAQLVDVERLMLFDTQETGELLTEEEAQELALNLNPPTALESIKAFFTGKVPSPRIKRFIDFNLRQQALGADAWGQYKNGVVSVVNNTQGLVGSKIVRHEMFHKIFWEFLTSEERLRALDLARAQWGEADIVTQEERLADAFANFQRPEPSWLVQL